MSGACLRRWGSGRGRNPASKHVQYRDGDLELPVPLGIQPGTFGGPLVAPYPLCSQSLPDANTGRSRRSARECPQKSAGVRY
jgi:hypothetical protein